MNPNRRQAIIQALISDDLVETQRPRYIGRMLSPEEVKADPNIRPYTRDEINADPVLYSAVGQKLDAGDLDAAYVKHRLAGLHHLLAKTDAYYDVFGREYPYGRPGKESATDRMLVSEGRMAGENKRLQEEVVKLGEMLNQQKSAGAALASASNSPASNSPADNSRRNTALVALASLLAGGGIGYALRGQGEELPRTQMV